MKKKIKKSRVLWISRDAEVGSETELYPHEPTIDEDGMCWGSILFSFCDKVFRRLFPIGLRPGQKKKVKITIEVIE